MSQPKNFVKVEDGVVVQKQPYLEDGFIEAPDEVLPGFLYDGEDFEAPPVPGPTWDEVRAKRTSALYLSDWTQLADSPLSDEEKEDWAEYRQSLRDITEHETPEEALENFPEPPAA